MKEVLEHVLEDKSFKGIILVLKQMELILRFCSSIKSLLDHNLTSSFAGTYSKWYLVSEDWIPIWGSSNRSYDSLYCKWQKIQPKRHTWLKSTAYFDSGVKCVQPSICGLCFPLLPLFSGSIQYHPFCPLSSRFHIFIPSHPGENDGLVCCAFGEEERREEREKEESEGRERSRIEGKQRASLYQLLFFRKPSKGLLLSCWPWLDYMLSLNNSPRWEYENDL